MTIVSDETERFAPILESYGNSNSADMVAYYDKWAPAYEADVDSIGWVGWRRVVDMFLSHLSERGPADVIDFGCGTGKAGVYLRSRTPLLKLIGVDVSSGMLELAAKKQCYDELKCIGSSGDLLLSGDVDGIICSGVFTHSHIQAEEIRNLLAVLKPGGVLSISARESYCSETGMAEIVKNIAKEGFLILDEVRRAPYQELLSTTDAEGAYWVIRREP